MSGPALIAMVFALTAAAAQEAAASQPYAGLEARAVKALSEEQIADLKAGRGAGFALAAELNGYPGPSHVLELAEALGLTPEQSRKTRDLFEAMKAETMPLGERLIAEEAALDRLFASRKADPAAIDAATRAIADTQGRLRAAHLKYHLTMVDVLDAGQVTKYAALRGYAGTGAPAHGHGGHRP